MRRTIIPSIVHYEIVLIKLDYYYQKTDISNSVVKSKYIPVCHSLHQALRHYKRHILAVCLEAAQISACFLLLFFFFFCISVALCHSDCGHIVHLNMHSFLLCFINMHSALIEENDKHIPQTSSTHNMRTKKNSRFLFCKRSTVVTQLHWLVVLVIFYVLPMERPTFILSAELCFCERFSHQPQCLSSVGQRTGVVKRSGIISCRCSFALYDISHLDFLYKRNRNNIK